MIKNAYEKKKDVVLIYVKHKEYAEIVKVSHTQFEYLNEVGGKVFINGTQATLRQPNGKYVLLKKLFFLGDKVTFLNGNPLDFTQENLLLGEGLNGVFKKGDKFYHVIEIPELIRSSVKTKTKKLVIPLEDYEKHIEDIWAE